MAKLFDWLSRDILEENLIASALIRYMLLINTTGIRVNSFAIFLYT